MKWAIKFKDGDKEHFHREEFYNSEGEFLGLGEIIFFYSWEKADNFLSGLDGREYERVIVEVVAE